MNKQIRFRGVKRDKFIPFGEVEKYHNDIKKIDLKFDAEYIKLNCPECSFPMELIPVEVRKNIMEIGVKCSKCKKYKFLIKIDFDRDFCSLMEMV